MKKDLNHIDEIFKITFENFEADVDPNVWTNVQQNISTSVNATSPSSSSGSVGSTITKSVLFKAAATILVSAGVVGSVYIINNSGEEKKTETENIENFTQEIVSAEENNVAITQNGSMLNEYSDSGNEENNNTSNLISENNQQSITPTDKEITPSNPVSNTNPLNENITTQNTEVNNSINVEQKVVANNESTNEQKTIVQPKELSVKIKSNVKKGKAPLYVEFIADSEVTSYLWDFGDGNHSNEENPFHTYNTPGKYKVSLTVMDKNAKSKTVIEYIEVEKNITSKIEEIQNVFSPNGDGINDVIKIEGENIKDFHAVIMDVKGNILFEWESLDGFWDGKDNNNNLLPRGTYYIAVTAIGEDGKKHTPKKSIQLY